jgi:hypothetical protein
MKTNLRHIVLFKIKDGVNELQIESAIKLLKELGIDNPSIIEWTVEKSLDERKGKIIIENSLFKSKEISDWIIGDYIEAE